MHRSLCGIQEFQEVLAAALTDATGLEQMRSALQNRVREDGEDATALNQLSVVLFHMARWQEALHYYDQAFDRDGDLARAYRSLSHLPLLNDELNQLIAHFAQHLATPGISNKDAACLLYYKGRALEQLGHKLDAHHDLTKAISLDSSLLIAYDSRGVVNRCLQRPREAIDDYTVVIRNCYKDRTKRVATYYNRAIALKADNKRDLALADYTYVLNVDPHFSHALGNRGLLFEEQEKYDLALEDFSRAIDIEPVDVDFRRWRGDLLCRHLKDLRMGMRDLIVSLALSPSEQRKSVAIMTQTRDRMLAAPPASVHRSVPTLKDLVLSEMMRDRATYKPVLESVRQQLAGEIEAEIPFSLLEAIRDEAVHTLAWQFTDEGRNEMVSIVGGFGVQPSPLILATYFWQINSAADSAQPVVEAFSKILRNGFSSLPHVWADEFAKLLYRAARSPVSRKLQRAAIECLGVLSEYTVDQEILDRSARDLLLLVVPTSAASVERTAARALAALHPRLSEANRAAVLAQTVVLMEAEIAPEQNTEAHQATLSALYRAVSEKYSNEWTLEDCIDQDDAVEQRA